MISLDDYVIREAEDHEKPAIFDFLMRHFYPQEFLLNAYIAKNKSMISEEEHEIIKADYRAMYEVMLNEQPSLLAIHRETQSIAAINMMLIVENPNLSNTDEDDDDDVTFRSKLLSEWYTSVICAADDAVDFFRDYPTISATLEVCNLGTHPAHADAGLAIALIQAALDLTRSRKIDIMYGLCSSPLSCKAAARVGCKSYKEIDILSFRDSKGNQVYEGMEPYKISVMAISANDACRLNFPSKL